MAQDMPPRRRRVVIVFLACFLLGSATAVVTGKELWPFSPYPMYRDTRHETKFRHGQLVGVLADGTEVRLRGRVPPFNVERLNNLLWKLHRNEVTRPRVARVLQDAWRRYRDPSQQLVGLRFYDSAWDFTTETPHVPTARTLVAEAP